MSCFGIMQETMSNEHAMRFPFVGSAMLLSLFLLFKFLSKDLVNTVLTLYFFVLGIVALSYVLYSSPLFFFCYYVDARKYLLKKILFSILWHLCSLSSYRATLLPSIKRFLPKQWNEDVIVWRFPYFTCMSCACHLICLFSCCEWMMLYR
jgi:minor histocompatibility antigen H13